MHDCVQIIREKLVEINICLLVEMTKLEAELSEEEKRNVLEYFANFKIKQQKKFYKAKKCKLPKRRTCDEEQLS